MTSAPSAIRTKALSLRTHLLVLAFALLGPALMLGLITTLDLAQRLRGSTEARLATAGESARQVVEREVAGSKLVLSTLATSPLLDQPAANLEALHATASVVGAMMESWVVLYPTEAGGMPLLNTRVPFGTPVPAPPDTSFIQQVVSTGQPAVSDILQLPETGQALVAVAVPVLRGGVVTGVLAMPLQPDRLARLLLSHATAEDGAAVVLSGDHRIIARAPPLPDTINRPTLGWMVSAMEGRESGVITGRGVDGVASVFAFTRMENAGWIVLVRESASRFDSTWRGPALRLTLLGALLMLATVIAAGWLARRLLRPLGLLSAQANRSPSGMEQMLAGRAGMARVAEFEALAASVHEMERALRREAENAARSAVDNANLAREAQDDRSLLSSVMQSVPDALFVKDLDMRYVLINEAGAGFFNMSVEEIIGRTDAELMDPAAADVITQRDQAVLAADEFREHEDVVVSPDGRQRRTFVAVKGPWRDSSGRVAGLVGVARDMTQRIATERKLAQAEEAMRRIARADSMAAMSVGLAHELNQPLTAANNFLRAAMRLLNVEAPDDRRIARAREAMGEAATQTVRVGEIIQRLRDFIGRGETERRRLELGGLAIESVALARAAHGREAAPIPIVMDGKRHAVVGDAVQLQQVLVNLLRNALEATETLPAPRIMLRLSIFEGDVRLEVEDNGPGMAPEILERLFEPFLSTKSKGMGIGLSICRAIVEAHHGKIEATTPEGGGTVLRVTLPMAET